jgi:hypothetical protein
MNNLRLDLIQFLRLLEKIFPYSTMNKDFNGKHSITLKNNNALNLGIWYKDKNFNIELEEHDFMDIQQTLLDIKELYFNK